MAYGSGGKSLEETPTWAVVVVCFVLVSISIIVEHSIHLIGKWLKKKHKRALSEALEKIKAELMLLGFISLLLTVGQEYISNICISKSVANTWHPCPQNNENNEEHRRKLLLFKNLAEESFRRRVLAGEVTNKCATKNQVPFISTDGIHQLHIFIFVLAVSHVLCCVLTLALGSAKMRSWEAWEKETSTVGYQFSHDPESFRFARETSFARRHMTFWTKNPVLLWIICFLMQFVRSVPKVDYLTLRHGFILTHLAPQGLQHFNFQKYINRSLEKDFKVVVGISPPIWFFAMIFIICNTQGSYSYIWLPFIPLVIILLVGTKLQMVITKMAIRIVEKGELVKGVPVVELSDDQFWFNRPRLILFLINFVLFQNAFQLAFLAWNLMEFGIDSCFHEHIKDVVVRITMGVLIQILCSYVTLPLYALVTQMGSTMKPTIFDEKIATALRHWHHKAKKNIKLNHQSGSTTPFSSCPVFPSGYTLPVYLLSYNETDIYNILQSSPSHYHRQQGGDISLSQHHSIKLSYNKEGVQERRTSTESPSPRNSIDVKEFSFHRRAEHD